MDEQPITDTTDSLSQTDVILPSQYFGAIGSVGLSSEQRLMLAVLVDAINILQAWRPAGSARKRRTFAETAQWVNTSGTHYPFTFDSVCDALEIDPEVLRARMRALTMGLGNKVRASIGRLRLKELSRPQNMSANRIRHRGKRRAVANR